MKLLFIAIVILISNPIFKLITGTNSDVKSVMLGLIIFALINLYDVFFEKE